jgi:membrane protein required for colicin V production
MNGLDFIFLIILGFTAVRGFARGLLKEFISVFGLIIGLGVATMLYEPAAERLEPFVSDPVHAAVIGYILVFLIAVGGIALVGLGLQTLFESSMLSSLGRLGGVLIGLLKGGVVCSLILVLLAQFLPPKADFMAESSIRPYVKGFSQNLMALIPEEFQDTVQEKGQEVKETWEDSLFKKLKDIE